MESSTSIIEKGKKRLQMVILIGIPLLVLLFLISIAFGPVRMTLDETYHSLINIINYGPQTGHERIIYYLRMPRVLAAFTIGIGLSIAGAVFQAIIRNPLVDPYITGVSSGAGFAAAMAMTSGLIVASVSANYAVPVAAFIGGLVAFTFTFIIAESSGGRAINYVLGGVIVGMGFGSLTTIILIMSDDRVQRILLYLFGSFTGMTWAKLWIILIPVLVLCFIVLLYAREFNVILLGDEQARQLGLNVKRFKISMLVLASLLTSLCVSFVGIIGFVGLIVPHTARMIVGGDHRLLLPACMIIGALVMALADLIAKMAYVPIELPVGAIMTLIGVPFFAYLLIRRGKEYAT